MGDVIPFPAEERSDDIVWDGEGPPDGVVAWRCNCGSYALYMTEERTHCWECHDEQILT